MSKYSGYVIIFDEDRRVSILQERGLFGGRFTDALSAPDWGFGDIEVCFLSFDGETIDAACLAKKGARVATAKVRVEFTKFIDLESLPIEEIESRFSAKLAHHFVRATSGKGKRVPLSTWQELVEIIKALRPNHVDELDRLLLLQVSSRKRFYGPGADTVAIERDAIGIALDIFDSSKELRKTTLVRWAPTEEALPPFLAGLEALKLTEEQMLAHDAWVFPDATVAATTIGARFETRTTALDVIYQNRTSVEKTLGVDLIYYNHMFDAYTLVQYKRMTKEKLKDHHNAVYRPLSDKNFDSEVGRMRGFRDACPDVWNKPKLWNTYRLNGDSFYFKFCPSVSLELLSSDLIKGMYLPREYLESLLESTVTDGKKGGKLITFENVQRHISNTEFVWLVHDGWVGTRGVSTEAITEIIRASLDAGRAVVYAHSSELARREEA